MFQEYRLKNVIESNYRECFPLFQNLNRRGAPGGSKKEGQRPENRHKNRVKHLVPCELLVQV